MSRTTDEMYEVMLILEQEGYDRSYSIIKTARERMIRMEEYIIEFHKELEQ